MSSKLYYDEHDQLQRVLNFLFVLYLVSFIKNKDAILTLKVSFVFHAIQVMFSLITVADPYKNVLSNNIMMHQQTSAFLALTGNSIKSLCISVQPAFLPKVMITLPKVVLSSASWWGYLIV